MSGAGGIDFAFVAAPVGEDGLSDAALYKEILATATSHTGPATAPPG